MNTAKKTAAPVSARAVKIALTTATITMMGMNSALAIDIAMEMPPGLERVLQVLGWIMWAVGGYLLGQFLLAVGKAGRARERGEESVEAPIKPAIWGAVLLAAPTIWTILTGM